MDTEHDVGRVRQIGPNTYTCDNDDPVDDCQVSAILEYGGGEHARVTISTPYAVADYPMQPHLSPLENAEMALREWFTTRNEFKEKLDDTDHHDG